VSCFWGFIKPFSVKCNYHLERHFHSLLGYSYVDDVSFGADDDDNAYKLYVKSKQILREGGFNLRKFVTNSTWLQQRIDETEGELAQGCSEGNRARVGEDDKTY